MDPLILTRRFGVPGSHTLAVARELGAYAHLGEWLSLPPAELTARVTASGLRGRGGAGFPTGRKWTFVPPPEKRAGKPVYLLCNGDESEPGTFKDRYLLWHDPHAVLEGMILAARAIGSHRAWLYLRGEFRFLQVRVDRALEEIREAGFLGSDILGSGYDLQIHTHLGAGAYVCGEETGLIESLEGRKGQPRVKPPFPAVAGLWGAPTVVNNVETLANVPWILEHGPEAFRALGTRDSPGTKLFCCSGTIRRPGVYELPLGIPFATLLEQVLGGLPPGRSLQAVIPGGSSVPVLTAREAMESTLDYECMARLGTFLGSGGVIVLDDSVDLVEALTNLARFYAHESCGQCTPCREGCGWMYRILKRILQGEGRAGDLETLLDLCDGIEGRTICALGAAAAMPVRSFLTRFRPQFEARIPCR